MVWFNQFELWCGVTLICLISVTQSFIQFKLSQLVYILPEKYKWNMVAAQASGGIFIAVFDTFLRGTWTLIIKLLALKGNESETWPTIVNTISTFLGLSIYIFSYIISRHDVKRLAESKLTIYVIKLYLDEKEEKFSSISPSNELDHVTLKSY